MIKIYSFTDSLNYMPKFSRTTFATEFNLVPKFALPHTSNKTAPLKAVGWKSWLCSISTKINYIFVLYLESHCNLGSI